MPLATQNRVFYSISACRGLALGLFSPIWVVYLIQHDISLLQIGLLGAVLEVARLIFEIPSGTFSDRFGEKFSLQLSALFGMVCWAILGFLPVTFANSCLAMVFLALSGSLSSGSFESWISKRNEEANFSKILAHSMQISLLFFIVGALVSGHLYEWHVALPFAFTCVLLAANFFIATMATPAPKSPQHEAPSITGILADSLRLISTQKMVLIIMCATFFINMAYDTVERYWQPFSIGMGFQESSLGYVLAVAGLLAAVCLECVKRVNMQHGMLLLAGFELVAAGLIFAMLYSSGLAVLLAISLFLSIGRIRGTIEQMVLNAHIPVHNKATVFSCVAAVGAAGEILAGVVFGICVQQLGIGTGFAICAGLLVVSLLLFVVYIYRANSGAPIDQALARDAP